MIPQETLDKILSAASVTDVISDYVTLRRSGANHKCVCPFHADKDASLVVSPAKGLWKCFGCGKGGNAISFVQEHEGLSFLEAVKIVADKYNITVPQRELDDKEKAELQRRESLFIALDFAQEHFRSHVADGEAKEYLSSRHISAETLDRFQPGFAPMQFQMLFDKAISKGYSRQVLIDAGLVNLNAEKAKVFDRFINRITFPFFNLSGKITGFTGRSLDKSSDVKYLNSPDTELFSKGNILFGLYQARTFITQRDKCFLVEGQFDVMSFADNGFQNTVCGSGTAFTRQQAKSIRKFTRNITLVYDGDPAGVKASIRNADILLSEGFNVRAALLPDGEDPDTFARKMGANKLAKWITKNESDIVSFVYAIHKDEISDPIRHNEVIEQICASIAMIPSETARITFTNKLSAACLVPSDVLFASIANYLGIRPKQEMDATLFNQDGIYGLEDAAEFLTDGRKEVTVTFDQDRYAADWGATPTVFVKGDPDNGDLQKLRSTSYVINCRDLFQIGEDLQEPEGIQFLRKLATSGFSVTITETESSFATNGEGERKKVEKHITYGFFEYYIRLYSELKIAPEFIKSKAVERCAELISHIDNTTRALNIRSYAADLGVTKAALESVVKPYLDRRKAENRFRNDSMSEDEDTMPFDSSREPDYVEEDPEIKKIYRTHGFFPLLDKKGRKIAYIFKQKNSFIRVGNFHLSPLLHVYSKNSDENKRVMELTVARIPYPIYMEWTSKDLITMQSFRQRLWDEESINFSNGSQQLLDQINESWSGKFQKCTELRIYGHYEEGFWAFSNAIYHKVDDAWKVEEVNELGLVQHNNVNFYLPAFSKIYMNERRDSDRYFLDRFMMYRTPKCETLSFDAWAKMLDTVYAQNDNGKWAAIYAFMCVFRSDIFSVDRIFTALFFIGPVGSGKSEIAYSIRALFMPREAPVTDLNSVSRAALFTLMEKYRNIPLMLEEYNNLLDDEKFQALKSAVYAGEGKQKRKDASSKDIDSSEINAPLILLGQESPQRDGNSLATRVIIRDVHRKDNRTKEEDLRYQELKSWEKKGLHNILLELIPFRSVVREKYVRVQREIREELKDAVTSSVVVSDGLSRMLNTCSMFLSVCKIIEQHTSLNLPFTYESFFKLACDTVVRQTESVGTSNQMHAFFISISTMIDKGSVREGRDFKIEQPGRITLQKQGRETYLKVLDPPSLRLLHIRLENIYQEYLKTVPPKEALSKMSLLSYMQSDPAYIGTTRATRFCWQDVVEVPIGQQENTADGEPLPYNNTMKRVMQDKSTSSSSIVLDYDKLKELLNVDYERNVSPEKIKEEEETNVEF